MIPIPFFQRERGSVCERATSIVVVVVVVPSRETGERGEVKMRKYRSNEPSEKNKMKTASRNFFFNLEKHVFFIHVLPFSQAIMAPKRPARIPYCKSFDRRLYLFFTWVGNNFHTLPVRNCLLCRQSGLKAKAVLFS